MKALKKLENVVRKYHGAPPPSVWVKLAKSYPEIRDVLCVLRAMGEDPTMMFAYLDDDFCPRFLDEVDDSDLIPVTI